MIGVSPPGGSPLRRGASVTLSVSKGVTVRTVPKITNMTIGEATTLLQQHGLTVGDQTQKEDLSDAGTVISQDPAAGATAPVGSAVAVVISKGPKEVLVPDLGGQDLDTAKATLKQAGLILGHIGHTSSTDQPVGLVVSNDPAGGTQAAEGSPVDILLSSGKPLVTMPQVYGEDAAQAAQDIQTAGLVPRDPSFVQTTDPTLDGKVRKTSPEPGKQVRAGSPVIISAWAYTAPSTDTSGTTTTDTTTTPTPPVTPQQQ